MSKPYIAARAFEAINENPWMDCSEISEVIDVSVAIVRSSLSRSGEGFKIIRRNAVINLKAENYKLREMLNDR